MPETLAYCTGPSFESFLDSVTPLVCEIHLLLLLLVLNDRVDNLADFGGCHHGDLRRFGGNVLRVLTCVWVTSWKP